MKITQRTATLEDAAQILDWRNNPRARRFSLNTTPISSDEHVRWFSARLKRVILEPFFIFEIEGCLVGMSRLDILPELSFKHEISILVDPEHQGKGIGAQILEMTCCSYTRTNPNGSIVAKVHKNNTISQNLFKRAGFDLLTSSGDFFEYEKN
jgi:RimJ/RimL family protein N-acetyltransferase